MRTWSVREGLPFKVIFKGRPDHREGTAMLMAMAKESKYKDSEAEVSQAIPFSFMAKKKMMLIKSVNCLNTRTFNGS